VGGSIDHVPRMGHFFPRGGSPRQSIAKTFTHNWPTFGLLQGQGLALISFWPSCLIFFLPGAQSARKRPADNGGPGAGDSSQKKNTRDAVALTNLGGRDKSGRKQFIGPFWVWGRIEPAPRGGEKKSGGLLTEPLPWGTTDVRAKYNARIICRGQGDKFVAGTGFSITQHGEVKVQACLSIRRLMLAFRPGSPGRHNNPGTLACRMAEGLGSCPSQGYWAAFKASHNAFFAFKQGSMGGQSRGNHRVPRAFRGSLALKPPPLAGRTKAKTTRAARAARQIGAVCWPVRCPDGARRWEQGRWTLPSIPFCHIFSLVLVLEGLVWYMKRD